MEEWGRGLTRVLDESVRNCPETRSNRLLTRFYRLRIITSKMLSFCQLMLLFNIFETGVTLGGMESSLLGYSFSGSRRSNAKSQH